MADSIEQRLDRLEAENQYLQEKVEVLTGIVVDLEYYLQVQGMKGILQPGDGLANIHRQIIYPTVKERLKELTRLSSGEVKPPKEG